MARGSAVAVPRTAPDSYPDRTLPLRSRSGVLPPQNALGARHPVPRWLRRYVTAAVVSDLVAAALAAVTAYAVRFGSDVVPATVLTLSLFPLLWCTAVVVSGGYRTAELGTGNAEFRSIIRAGVGSLAAIAFISYAVTLELSRGLVVIAVPGAVVAGAVDRYLLRRRVHRLRMRGRCMRLVLAVGREGAVLDLVRQLRRDRYCGMEVVAACVPDPQQAVLLRGEGVRVMGNLQDAALTVRALGVHAVAVTSSSETAAAYLRRLSWELEGSGVELLVAPGLMEVAGPRMHMRPFIGLPLLYVEEPRFTGPTRLLKIVLDWVAAGLALLVLLPVLVAAAVAVRVSSLGPVLFRQQRIGQSGRPFTMLKFRTMVVDAESRRAEVLQRNQNA